MPACLIACLLLAGTAELSSEGQRRQCRSARGEHRAERRRSRAGLRPTRAKAAIPTFLPGRGSPGGCPLPHAARPSCFSPVHESTAAKLLPLPPCPGLRQNRAPVKHCAVLGWSLDFPGLNQALPCTSLSPKKAYLINPVFYRLCCWWILCQGTQTSSPHCPDPHTAPAHSGSCSRLCAGVANSSHHPAFSQSCFSQLFLASPLGSH